MATTTRVKNLYKNLGVFGPRDFFGAFSGLGKWVFGKKMDRILERYLSVFFILGYICIQGGSGRYVLSRASYRRRFFLSFPQRFTVICLDLPFL